MFMLLLLGVGVLGIAVGVLIRARTGRRATIDSFRISDTPDAKVHSGWTNHQA